MILPEPQIRTRSLQSAPPSFKARVKPVQTVYMVTNGRMRALSAPSIAFDMAEQDALSSAEFDELEDSRSRTSMKEPRSLSPQPLPLPSPQGAAVLKTAGSFKSAAGSGPLYPSGPLPLPPSGALRSFLIEEISAACHNFSVDRWTSGGLSSIMYRASFGEDNSSSRKFEATVTCLQTSTQVTSALRCCVCNIRSFLWRLKMFDAKEC